VFTALLVALVVGLWMLVLARDNAPRARIAQLEARLAAMQTQLDAKQDASNRAAQNVQVKRNAIKKPLTLCWWRICGNAKRLRVSLTR